LPTDDNPPSWALAREEAQEAKEATTIGRTQPL